MRALVVLVLLRVTACADPVRSERIDALGAEEPGVAPGADHRPGQPCLVCHSTGGPAGNKAFAVAGTIFATSAPDSAGADNIIVQFVDAKGGSPVVSPQTGPSGNFYVPLQDWRDVAFPIRVALYNDLDQPPIQVMRSLIGREGSCNYCHAKNLAGPLDEAAAAAQRASAGQIYVTSGGGS